MPTRLASVLVLFLSVSLLRADVVTLRVPSAGIQPQVAVDEKTNIVHLIYFKGDPQHGDVFYVSSKDGGATWTSPLRVNSQPGSAMAIGTIRGAHLAIGKAGRVHVAWMGSQSAEPKPAGTKANPMLYARLNDAHDAFEPQKNVIQQKIGLDGGGSIAADESGNVFVVWHAPQKRGGEEADRHVFLATSHDEGNSFQAEENISPPTGACGCCGMRAFAHDGAIFVLYRAATEQVHRGMYLLRSRQDLKFSSTQLDDWKLGQCAMSSTSFAASPQGVLAAWENNGQIEMTRFTASGNPPAKIAPPGSTGNRKHPVVASSSSGAICLAWAEGTGWNKGGSVAWQLFDQQMRPIVAGSTKGLPVWSMPAVFQRADGSFTILY